MVVLYMAPKSRKVQGPRSSGPWGILASRAKCKRPRTQLGHAHPIHRNPEMKVIPFSAVEKSALLCVKGVGPKVIERLEQMGFSSLRQLADADARDILAQGAALSGSSCWKNSPQAKAAVEAAIGAASTAVDSYATDN